ncbi:unnamed protein product [Symbiodinium sp. KB8]|nr:unnamed protein product [Symbiodinium sp. KB8]
MASGALLAWSIVSITYHWWRTKADLVLLRRQVVEYFRQVGRGILISNLTSSKRIDEAMNRLREENYVASCRLLQHAALTGLITIPITYGDDLLTCTCMMLLSICSYMIHTSIASGSLRPSTRALRILFCFYYIMMMAHVWFSPQAAGSISNQVNQKALLTAQFAGVVCFVDSKVHVPGQIAMLLAEVGRFFAAHGRDGEVREFVEFLASAFGFTMIVITASVLYEHTIRERFSAQFRHVDAEQMIASFRTLLHGVCDAEILLDGQLRILDEGAGLKRLLSTSESLRGKDFQEFLTHDEDEKSRFSDFISKCDGSTDESRAPPCLRVSMQPKSCGRLGIDLFHVAVPQLYDCDGVCHLLAMKLDADCLAVPDAKDISPCLSQIISQPLNIQRPSSRAGFSDCSGPVLLQSPGLKEIMLLINAKDHAVTQVHLSYKRSRSKRGRSALAPSLRDFVRPTDWGTVSQRVLDYARRESICAEESLERVYFRTLDRPSAYMLAQSARLKPYAIQPAGQDCSQFWLHLKDFRRKQQPEQRAPSELADIGEGFSGDGESETESP